MKFDDETVRNAFNRSRGYCECKRSTCGHSGKCTRRIDWNKRGSEGEGGWEAHHVNSNGPDTLSNCEILCQPCHKSTESFGQH